MEIKEAIEWLKNIDRKYIHGGDEDFDSKRHEAMRMAIYALEKQIAKKPKHIEVLDGNWAKVCPTCRRVLMERITTDEISYPRHYNTTGYCWCGQRIDWSE